MKKTGLFSLLFSCQSFLDKKAKENNCFLHFVRLWSRSFAARVGVGVLRRSSVVSGSRSVLFGGVARGLVSVVPSVRAYALSARVARRKRFHGGRGRARADARASILRPTEVKAIAPKYIPTPTDLGWLLLFLRIIQKPCKDRILRAHAPRDMRFYRFQRRPNNPNKRNLRCFSNQSRPP
jgi:hypothetical protein